MNINLAKAAFIKYTNQFESNQQIQLKIKHTWHVCQNMETLTRLLRLSKSDRQIAWVIALLHDIGRFEQMQTYQTFLDAKSENHALLGIRILMKDDFIRYFISEDTYDDLIRCAIRNHNRFQIEKGLSSREILFVHLLRDADKIDIFRVDQSESTEVLFQCSHDMLCNDIISNDVFEHIVHKKSILSSIRKSKADIMVSHMALIFDLYYRESIFCVCEQGYFDAFMNRFIFCKPCVQQRYHLILHTIQNYIQDRKR